MKIGNDEKIILSLLVGHPHLTRTNLQLLYVFVTGKKRDTSKMIQSLKIKGLLDEKNNPIKGQLGIIPDIKIDKEILDNVDTLDEFVKLGRPAKSILYILSQIKKSSLQFLAGSLGESSRNTYAVLQRMEEKSLVYSYNSKIYHLNVRGRRFSPKYYVITDLGKIVAKVKADGTIDYKKIDALLQKTSGHIESMHKIFSSAKNACLLLFSYAANLVILGEMGMLTIYT